MRGYLSALMTLSFYVLESEAVTTNCEVRSGSNVTMPLDETSVNVREVSLFKGKKEIASSRSLSVGWDDFLDDKYKGRLFLSAKDNMTIHLHHVTIDDEGNYTTIVTWENGNSLKKYWNIKTGDLKQPELRGEFTISVTKEKDGYHCTCGDFTDNTIPQLHFKWNISSYNVHKLLCKRNESVSCTASWPVSECQDVIKTWTASHRGEPAADGGNQNGGRRKRSTDDTGCVPANNTSPESTDETTTGHTEVTTVNNDVVVAATVPIAVIVVVVTVTTTVCCLRRKKKQYPQNRNISRSEHETKGSPNEEKMEMIN